VSPRLLPRRIIILLSNVVKVMVWDRQGGGGSLWELKLLEKEGEYVIVKNTKMWSAMQ